MSVRAATARSSATNCGSSKVAERSPMIVGTSVDLWACVESADVPALGTAGTVDDASAEARSRCPADRNGCRVGAHVSVRTPLCRNLRQVVTPLHIVGRRHDARYRERTGRHACRRLGRQRRRCTRVYTDNHRDGLHDSRASARARQPTNGDSVCSGQRSVRPTRRDRGRSLAHGAPHVAATRLPLGVAVRPLSSRPPAACRSFDGPRTELREQLRECGRE
jgi:hypothetical protein